MEGRVKEGEGARVLGCAVEVVEVRRGVIR